MNTGGIENLEIPTLEGPAADAVAHRGSHIQIIACAGAGKTETVSQRVARLVAEGVEPAKIVAFTFTEKAAAELKERIRIRVLAMAGESVADKLGNMYVGTIHGFCFQLVSKYDGRFESYDVLDAQQVAAFLQRMSFKLKLKEMDPAGGLFSNLKKFISNVDVLENELLEVEDMPEPFRTAVKDYYEQLEKHRLMTFGQQIAHAVRMLEDEAIRERIAEDIEHLIVDEYQDVNPAQERLIELLAKPVGNADLVVVGDDDQAIYQWRGSKVENILKFTTRYENVTTFELLQNRRSRPQIVELAEKFAETIPNRLAKEMKFHREAFGPAVDICYDYDDEEQEANNLAISIQKLRRDGFPYRTMAVLVRSKTAYPAILDAFERHGVPVQPGGRTGLFGQSDADFLGRVFSYLSDVEWTTGQYQNKVKVKVTLESLLELATKRFALSKSELREFTFLLARVKGLVGTDSRKISLVGICYEILELLGVKNWDDEDELLNARRGTIARFIKLVADYEGVQMRATFDEQSAEQVSASDQKEWYFRNLSILIANYAEGNYNDFEGEDDLESDAVELTTVHSSKGLEWPIVFLPSLTSKRFPSTYAGKTQDWLIPREMFDADRYEGGDSDERRLFYVAFTRARDWISLSAHRAVKTQTVPPSDYIKEMESFYLQDGSFPELEKEFDELDENSDLQITYSEIADYLSCGYSYWLRGRIGFPSELVRELGYGKAVHHLLRSMAEFSQKHDRKLTPIDIDRILAAEFYLPFAGKTLAARLKQRARSMVLKYANEHMSDLDNTWATERPFELALPGVIVSGRADVVIARDDADSLAIMDYKTSISAEDPSLQLQIYTEAGRREGLNVTGAYIHDLDKVERTLVDTSSAAIEQATEKIVQAANDIKARKFDAKPAAAKCGRCDVRAICRKAIIS